MLTVLGMDPGYVIVCLTKAMTVQAMRSHPTIEDAAGTVWRERA